MKKPLVTIVTVTYNLIEAGRKEYFIQCLESVHNQTYKNIEHIVIDGASNDGTVELIKEYADKGWIKYISEPDNGIYDAMNKGIDIAKGKYMAFLGSDDYYHEKNGIEKVVKLLEGGDVDFSYSPIRLVNENNEDVQFNHPSRNPNIKRAFLKIPFCHQTMFCKRSVMIKENKFNTDFKIAGDYDFLVRICIKNYKSKFLDYEFASYRVGGTSAQMNIENHKEVAQIYYKEFNKLYPVNKKTCEDIVKYEYESIPQGLAKELKKRKKYFDYSQYCNVQDKKQEKIYSVNQNIKLSLKDKVISREKYKENIEDILYYGKQIKKPKVSAIIVAWHERDDLIRNIEYLQKQTNKDFELFIVDNGLDNGIKEKLKGYSLTHIVLSKNLGPSAGRNIGACYANSDIFAFIDADGYVDERFVENILITFEDSDIVATRGKVIPINPKLQKDFVPQHYNLGDKIFPMYVNTEGCSAFRKKDYIKVGGMEDDLFGHEGVVICYRMCEFYGYDKKSFVYNPNIVLYHDFHNSDEKLQRKIRQYAILDRQLSIRYPFYKNFLEYYAKLLTKNGKVITSNIDKNKQIQIEKIKKDIYDELDTIKDKQLEKRRNNPKLVKDGDTKFFSVIIPCYNLGDLLPKAIDSVFAQTLEDIEVIVVDDASPDKQTQEVLNEIEQYVKVIRLKENGGVSVARNEGIRNAKSNYILCLDADDTIEPTYLEKAKNIFDADVNVGIVSCWAQFFGNSNALWKTQDKVKIKDALVDSPLHTAACFRKDLHDMGGGYDKKLRGFEDWDHWIRIMKQGCVVRVMPEALFNYRVSEISKVVTSNKNAFNLTMRIIDNHRDLYNKYYDYIISKKHEQIAKYANTWREKDNSQQNIKCNMKNLVGKKIREIIVKKKKIFPNKWI